jgi:ABC-type multidrug transport system, permease component
MSAFAYHVGYEFKSGIRDKSHLFMNYLFPLVFFALAGALMSRLDPSFAGRVVPAMAVFAVMCSFLLAMPSGLVTARDSGLLRSYRINGVPSWAAILAPSLANAAHMALATLIIAVVARATMGAPAPADWGSFGLAWLAMSAAIAGLGALIGVLAGSARAATLVAQCVYLPSIILGGLMTPPGALPPSLERLSLLFPARHAMRAFAGAQGSALSLTALGLSALLSFGAALALYEWDGKNSRGAGRKLLALVALLPYAATMAIA